MAGLKRWLRVSAYAIAITTLLAITALALRVSLVQPHRSHGLAGLAITVAIVTALVCAWARVALAQWRRPNRRPRA